MVLIHRYLHHDILDQLYTIASSPDYVRDMRIHEKLSSLLILLMEDAWDDTQMQSTSDTLDIQAIKDYLDENFKNRISLDDLAGSFYLNKYYLMKLFKDRYGMTINAYLNQARVTWVVNVKSSAPCYENGKRFITNRIVKLQLL